MIERRAIGLTAQREVRERLRSRAFRASTALQAAVLVAIVIVIGLIGADGPERIELAAIGERGEALAAKAEEIAPRFGAEVEVAPVATGEAATKAVADGDRDAAVAAGRVITGTSPPDQLLPLVQAAAAEVRGAEQLRAIGVEREAIERALDPPPLAVTEVGEAGGGESLAVLGSLLLYFAILISGFAVAGGVVEEKSTRVVEVILATIRPVELLAGKVIGIGLLGIGQVLVVIGAGLATALISGTVELPEATGATVALIIPCFLLGYLLYACAFAAAGAIVSRQEDTQSVTAPLQILLLAGYLVGQSVAWAPDSTAASVAIFVPPLAPLVLPALAAQGELGVVELLASLALVIATIALLLWAAARIYERAVLRIGAPLRLREAMRLAVHRAREPA